MNSRVRLAVVGFSVLTLVPLHAQIWTGDAGDNQWSTGGNWSTGTSPGPGDLATVQTTASINLPNSATTIEELDVHLEPSIIVGSAGNSFTTGGFFVSETGSLSLILTPGSTFTVTSSPSAVGDYRGGGTLTLSGPGTFTYAGTGIAPFFVGVGNPGLFDQTSGTSSFTALQIGANGSYFDSTNGAAGNGTYSLNGGSFAAGVVDLGVGASNTDAPSTGAFNMTAGTATVSIMNLGVSGTLSGTGTVNGDTGFVTQSGGTLSVTNLNIGESAGGVGSFGVTGSATLTATTVNLGDQAGASGYYTQSGGTGSFTTFNIGNNGTGSVSLTGGTLTTGGAVTVGALAGSVGMVSQGGGTLTIVGSHNLNVGALGTGSYGIAAGLLTVGGAIDIGTSSGSGGFTLAGGTVDAADGINVGGSTGTGVFNYNGGSLGATSTVTVGSNGTFNQNAGSSFTPTNQQVVLTGGGVYNLNGGTLTVGGDVTGGTSGISAANASAGTFNFNGGTVSASSNWTDELGGAVGTATINTNGNLVTLTGTLTGNGVLSVTSNGGGSVDLTGNNHSQSWSINVQNGTFVTNDTNFPLTGNVTLASTGTFHVTTAGTGTDVLEGSMKSAAGGAYNITFGSAPTLNLTGPVDLEGTTTLMGGGKLLVGTGTLGTVAQSGGVGSLEVGGSAKGSGVLTISGAATYTGATTVDAGYELLATSLNSSTGNVTVNGGIGSSVPLISLNGSPTLTIGGTLNSSGGSLVVRMFNGFADEVDVTGAGTTTIGAVTLGTAPEAGTYTIVETAAPGDLTPYAPTQISANRFVTVTVETSTATTNQDLVLIATANPTTSISGLVLTPNEQSVASSLNALIVNPSSLKGIQLTAFYNLLNAVGPNGTPNAQLATNLEQLTPESLQYAPTIAYENTTFMVQNLNNFETNIHHNFQGFDTSGVGVFMPGFDSGLGRELQGMLASFHDSAPNGVNYYPESDGSISDESPTPAAAPSTPEPSHEMISDSTPVTMSPHDAARTVNLTDPDHHLTEFLGGDVTLANLNQSQTENNAPTSKAHYTSGDGIAGIGYHMTSNLTAGILMDYNHTDAKTDNYGSHTRVDSYSPGLWASYGEKGFFANGLFSVGVNSYDNQRVVPVVNETATSNPGGMQYVGDLDLGYEFHPAFAWTLAPTLGLTYTHIDVDSFSENGADPADLSVNAQHDDSFRSRLGGYVTYLTHPGQVTLQPTFTAMWQHEYLDQSAQLTSQFNDFPAGAFTINSVTVGRDSALIGGGLTATFDNSMALFINATADLGSNYDAENLVAGFKSSF